MSEQPGSGTTPDPDEAGPSFEPPASPSQPTGYTPPAYSADGPATPPPTPPAAGYSAASTPPPFPGASDPNLPPPYVPPAAGYQPPAPGYPPPTYPAAGVPVVGPNIHGIPLADWGKRALGAVIDFGPTWVLSGISNSVVNNNGSTLLSSLLTILGIAWIVWNSGYKGGTTGVTLGRSVAKTKLLSEATGQPIGFGLAIVRHLLHFLDSLACFIGWLFPLWDAKRQTFADKIMKTVVIDNSADPDAGKFEWK